MLYSACDGNRPVVRPLEFHIAEDEQHGAFILLGMSYFVRGEDYLGSVTKRSTNLIAAACPCGRSIRVAASTLAEAPITCHACDGDFQAKNPADA